MTTALRRQGAFHPKGEFSTLSGAAGAPFDFMRKNTAFRSGCARRAVEGRPLTGISSGLFMRLNELENPRPRIIARILPLCVAAVKETVRRVGVDVDGV